MIRLSFHCSECLLQGHQKNSMTSQSTEQVQPGSKNVESMRPLLEFHGKGHESPRKVHTETCKEILLERDLHPDQWRKTARCQLGSCNGGECTGNSLKHGRSSQNASKNDRVREAEWDILAQRPKFQPQKPTEKKLRDEINPMTPPLRPNHHNQGSLRNPLAWNVKEWATGEATAPLLLNRGQGTTDDVGNGPPKPREGSTGLGSQTKKGAKDSRVRVRIEGHQGPAGNDPTSGNNTKFELIKEHHQDLTLKNKLQKNLALYKVDGEEVVWVRGDPTKEEWKIWVPTNLRVSFLWHHHDHQLAGCPGKYQTCKASAGPHPVPRAKRPQEPWKELALDLMGPYPCSWSEKQQLSPYPVALMRAYQNLEEIVVCLNLFTCRNQITQPFSPGCWTLRGEAAHQLREYRPNIEVLTAHNGPFWDLVGLPLSELTGGDESGGNSGLRQDQARPVRRQSVTAVAPVYEKVDLLNELVLNLYDEFAPYAGEGLKRFLLSFKDWVVSDNLLRLCPGKALGIG
ncbi:hypothetical protein PR048_013044 [Dryococelus australis]|uniref:Uncharacterized protein n=1 Tax=Dryococelus australis TaxID=614101 RepID=A0ABQ9HR05_9NEOP|nr:hypothetical protein PR048_013044 [Dryococelus australis]